MTEVATIIRGNILHEFSRDQIEDTISAFEQKIRDRNDTQLILSQLHTPEKMIRNKQKVKEYGSSIQILEETLNPESHKGHIKQLLTDRFIDNPFALSLVLKNKKGKVIGEGGVNQFQETQDTQMISNDHTALDPKHGFINDLSLTSEYGKAIKLKKAIKKSLITLAHKQPGYQYLWTLNDKKDNTSQQLSKQLGYKPLTAETTFADSPAFTQNKTNALLTEYNSEDSRLDWLKVKVKGA